MRVANDVMPKLDGVQTFLDAFCCLLTLFSFCGKGRIMMDGNLINDK